MKAQTIYDLRENYEFCSGTDLHEFFERTCGDPSPSGKIEIDTDTAKLYMINAVAHLFDRSPSVGVQWRDDALHAINSIIL